MNEFIQVNKLWINPHIGKYTCADFDCLLSVGQILQITPRSIDDHTNKVFQEKTACHIMLLNGDSFYVIGTLQDLKDKMGIK